jgi:DnaJ-class molecular chaperone
METDTLYRELDIERGASVPEIKAAFRKMAKSCHPDAAEGSADPARFSRVSAAYRSLLKEVMGALGDRRSGGAEEDAGEPEEASYRFIGRKTIGLDVFYEISVVSPGPGRSAAVKIPWVRREACPRCLGQGETLRRSGGGFVYKPSACPRCKGKGYIGEKKNSVLVLTPGMLRRGWVRVRNAGGYLPVEGTRGDLVLNIHVVEAVPSAN